MSLSAPQLVRRIHAAPLRIVLATTGGGASAIERLFAVPGASRTMLEAVVPYSAAAMDRFLGGTPEQYCSAETARAMAMAAFLRASGFAHQTPIEDALLAGVACTASLATDRVKRGPHRAHVAVQTADATRVLSLEFAKGERTRHAEEKLLGRWLLNVIAQTAGLSEQLELELLPGEQIASHETPARPGWSDLVLGDATHVRHGPATNAGAAESPTRAVFPGAFNPRHVGHRRLAEVARRRLAAEVEYEIAIVNVDKPPLDYMEMEQRLAQFSDEETVWFTRSALFELKAELFPAATFLVGADTIARIADPRYYGEDTAARDRSIEQLARHGCRFLVFGRLVDGTFLTLPDLKLTPSLRGLCEAIPALEFREDISSTELRRSSDAEEEPQASVPSA